MQPLERQCRAAPAKHGISQRTTLRYATGTPESDEHPCSTPSLHDETPGGRETPGDPHQNWIVGDCNTNQPPVRMSLQVKYRRAQTRRKFKKIPCLELDEGGTLTAFSGLVVLQALLVVLDLKERLRRCFAHRDGEAIYRHGIVLLQLVVQILLGHGHLRGRDLIAHDPMVQRVLGVSRLADVATVSRVLSGADARSVEAVRDLSRDVVLDPRFAPGRGGLGGLPTPVLAMSTCTVFPSTSLTSMNASSSLTDACWSVSLKSFEVSAPFARTMNWTLSWR